MQMTLTTPWTTGTTFSTTFSLYGGNQLGGDYSVTGTTVVKTVAYGEIQSRPALWSQLQDF